MLSVSIIIPAYNAAETLAQTIESLLAQTYDHWEAVIVNDGSTDETATIAETFANQDPRIRLITQSNAGVCTARNVGISMAKFDWILFNDSDDWIAPTHLEKITAVLAQNNTWDAVHCGWSRVAADGTIEAAKYGPALSDLFPSLANYCTFHVNTCVVRKALIETVGGFDTDVAYCEDWDLWQRIARMGARFTALDEVLSFYRMRPNSLSSHVHSFCRDGLRVLGQGYRADRRVRHAQPEYEFGLSPEPLLARQVYFVTWCAGLLLGRGEDARSLLDMIDEDKPVSLDPFWIAENLFETVPIPNSHSVKHWDQLWPRYYAIMQQFLQALEQRTQALNLTDRTLYQLEEKILKQSVQQFPLKIGNSYGITIELANPIASIEVPKGTQRIYSQITLENSELGYLQLPIMLGEVLDWAIRDIVSAQFTEPVLNQLLKKTGNISPAAFLQQLWHRPDWPWMRFHDLECPDMGYSSPTIEINIEAQPSTIDYLKLNINDELPHIKVLGEQLRIGLDLAGETIGAISFAGHGKTITPAQIRSTFTKCFEPALQRNFVRSRLELDRASTQLGLGISIVIPAYNAETYIRQTLSSLLSQTYPFWEAIVIDDGSGDETAAIAAEFARHESRIRLIRQSNQGGCAARNHGLNQAYFAWIVFLDADDWWEPTYLEKMTQRLLEDPTIDAVRCSWNRVTADGKTLLEEFTVSASTDTFESCVRACGFQIETCIVRRALVESVGGFDLTQKAAQDWDLWQRIARTGAKFGIVPEVLSYYRTVSSSVSSGGLRLLANGLKVIERGYTIDPRVPYSDPRYATGLDCGTQPMMNLYFMLWCAGLEIAQYHDASRLLEIVTNAADPLVTSNSIADSLRSTFLASGLPTDRWYTLWPQYERGLTQFLVALETQLKIPNLAQLTQSTIQRNLLRNAPLPQALGDTYGISIDIAKTIPTIKSSCNRAYYLIRLGDNPLGEIELPIDQGELTAEVLADAIAGEYFWRILEQFFQANVYQADELEKHGEIGWERFLQELLNKPDWNAAQFYETQDQDDEISAPLIMLEQPNYTIEISQDLPALCLNLDLQAETVFITLTIGGKPLGVIPVAVDQHRVSAAVLYSTLLTISGLELCRICVREAILGQSLKTGLGLRARLQVKANRPHPPIDPTTLPPIASCWWPKRDFA